MTVRIHVDDGVATITLDRPEAMNAIDPETRAELRSALAGIASDDTIRVVILTGAGDKAFCTGSDLKKTMPPKESFAELTFGRSQSDSIMGSVKIAQPIICAINGHAIGGGLEIALACDIRIASREASFGLSEVRIGSIPSGGGTQRLPRAIGLSSAMLLLLTGDRIDADEALRIGLVSRITSPEDLLPTAQAMARRIASNAPLAVRAVKRLVREGMEMPLEGAIELERYAFGVLRDTEDRIEGRRAFQEKRAPQYRGR